MSEKEAEAMEPTPDLSFLTPREKNMIMKVIKEDIKFNKENLSSLEIAVSDAREFQSSLKSSKNKTKCTCCAAKYAIISGRVQSVTCDQCSLSVCHDCIILGKQQNLCKICHKERFLDLQTQDLKIAPSNDSDDQQSGSELLKKSIEQTLPKEPEVKVPKETPEDAAVSKEATKDMHLEKQFSTPGSTSGTPDSIALTASLPATLNTTTNMRSQSIPSIHDPDSGFKMIKQEKSDENLAETSSLYSENCYEGDPITGKMTLGVWYRNEENTLYVKIVKIKGLSAPKGKGINPYVKTYLLPEKSKTFKRMTGIQRKTPNPEYDEILKYRIEREKIHTCTLWLSVWNWDPSGRNQFMGEVRLSLSSSSTDLSDSSPKTYQLKNAKKEEEETDSACPNGRLCIALKYELMSASVQHKQLKKSSTISPPSEQQSLKSRSSISRSRSPSPELDVHSALLSLLPLAQFQGSKPDKSGPGGMKKSPSLELAKRKSNERAASFDVGGPDLRVPRNQQRSRSLQPADVGDSQSAPSSACKLYIRVNNAEDLISMDSNGNTNPFVRCFLLPNRTVGGKKKTSVIKKSLNPVWEEELVYNFVPYESLMKERVLDVTVWDSDRRGVNTFMGGIRLGPNPQLDEGEPEWMDSTAQEADHWYDMLANHGVWMERWHNLRPSMTSFKRPPLTYEQEEVTDEVNFDPEHVKEDEEETQEGEEAQSLPKPQQLNLNRREKGSGYEISGEVVVTIDYENKNLVIKVCKAKGLAAVKKKTSSPYVKLYLLPGKQYKTSKVVKKSLNPTYNQKFKFEISQRDLSESTIWLTVWSQGGVLQHDFFLGEVCIPFEDHEFLTEVKETHYKLVDYSKMEEVPSGTVKLRRRRTTYRVRTKIEKNSTVPSLRDSSLDLYPGSEEAAEEEAAEEEKARRRSQTLPARLSPPELPHITVEEVEQVPPKEVEKIPPSKQVEQTSKAPAKDEAEKSTKSAKVPPNKEVEKVSKEKVVEKTTKASKAKEVSKTPVKKEVEQPASRAQQKKRIVSASTRPGRSNHSGSDPKSKH